ncbi:enoyl-CoA hydratase-related protein [Desulfotomaculum copahuensis]|uniref:2-(1,2-epoxy-1,2-dihydrophenyl)acetyl-CoA isomerase n=1 Tax=Desulfotomaculum copahuensis TaxID=1838280 RepID=A0A1B7LDE7_9FIRM|nr:enoyl-CoA hydratase-related protein [Desulfotomaculum copahuensis]OAT81133.1 2-(1,2-epoxy-1,2-dihydrophenyl)acetyl-CoA isomerase [Desulfotomaculum copahuensis]
MYQTILYEIREGVATLTLNRPTSLNSINRQMMDELRNALGRVQGDPSVRCLVLTGAGKGFCAGADLGAGLMRDPTGLASALKEMYNPFIRTLYKMEKPVVAAVNGVAAGAGCNMALACDMVIAAVSASFIQAFVNVGLVPDAGGSYFLPRLVGLKKAMEMVLLGDAVNAAEAERIGLINRVVPDDELASEAAKLARLLAAGPRSQGMIKALFSRSMEMDLDACLNMEAEWQARAASTEDCIEGINAFLQKRKPFFRGK